MIQADFHVHSRYSFDSFLSPRSIAKTALKKGLSVIAVADHNTTEGALKTIEEAASTSLCVIPAVELETDGGHVMGLFVESNIAAKSIDGVLDEIRGQGGIAVLLHPARMSSNKLEEAACKVDVIEALNGRTRRGDNLKAQDLAFKFNKPVVAGSDAHLSFEIGCVRTMFDASSSNLSVTFSNIEGQTQELVSTTDEATSKIASDYNQAADAGYSLQAQQEASQASFGTSVMAMNNVALAGATLVMSFERIENAQVMLDRANLMVQRSTETAEKAQTAYNDAVAKYGPNSAQAKEALDKLTIAQQAVQVAQERADMSARNYNNTMAMAALTVIPSLISIIGTVSHAQEIWTGIQWALNAAMDANPIGIIILAIAGLVAIIVYAYENCKPLRDIINAIGSALGGFFLAAVNAVRDALSWLWNNVINPVIGALQKLWDVFTNNPIMAIIGGPITQLIYVLTHWQDILATLQGALSWLWNNVLVPFGNFISGVFSPIISFLTGLFNTFYSIIKPIVDAVTAVANIMGGFVNTIVGALGNASSAIGGFISSVCFAHALQKAADESAGTMDNWQTMVKRNTDKALDSIKGFNAEVGISAVPNVGAVTGGAPLALPSAKPTISITITAPLVNIAGSADRATAQLAANMVKDQLQNVIIQQTSPSSLLRKQVRIAR